MALLNTFVSVRSLLANAEIAGAEIRGRLALSQQNLTWLKELSTNKVLEPTVTKNGNAVDIDDIRQADDAGTVLVVLYPRNLSPLGCDYFETFRELVERHPVVAPTHEYYVHEFAFFSHGRRPTPVENYHAVQNCVRLLRSLADYWDDRPPSGCLIFFHKEKFEIPITYAIGDLQPIPGLADFTLELNAAHDRQQRLSLLKIVIVELVANSGSDRFGHLLKNWPGLMEKFGNAYNLYLANFSWEKVRSEVDKEKIEFVKKLNATVTDIQTKLIAIPAAFLLIAAQLKNAGRFDISNLIVTIAAVTFAALIDFLIRNQLHALAAVNGDVERLRDRLKTEGHLVAEIADRFEELAKLYIRQKRVLWFCLVVSILVGFVSVGLFILYSFNNPFMKVGTTGP